MKSFELPPHLILEIRTFNTAFNSSVGGSSLAVYILKKILTYIDIVMSKFEINIDYDAYCEVVDDVMDDLFYNGINLLENYENRVTEDNEKNIETIMEDTEVSLIEELQSMITSLIDFCIENNLYHMIIDKIYIRGRFCYIKEKE